MTPRAAIPESELTTLRLVPPTLHKGQQQVLAAPEREVILICGRRWGKTRLGVVKGLFGSPHHVGALQGGRVWWVAPTYAVAGIAWRLAKSVGRQIPTIEIKEADRTLAVANGGELVFKSADRPDNLRGEGLDGLVIDEADFIERSRDAGHGPLYNEVLTPALADKAGWALLISTPNIQHGWLHRLYEMAKQGRRAGARAFHFTTLDNPFIKKKEIERIREHAPELAFRREILAEWVGNEGALVRADWIVEGTPPPNMPITVGVDLAVSEKESADYTAMVAVGRDDDGIIWVVDAERMRGTMAAQLDAIERFANAHRAATVAIEGNQFQTWLIQELRRRTSLPIVEVRAERDKPTRFKPVAERYERGLIRHARTLPPEFAQEICAFPDSLHDDFADALAYACRLSDRAIEYDWLSEL